MLVMSPFLVCLSLPDNDISRFKLTLISSFCPFWHIVIEEFEDTKGGNQNPYLEEEQITQWPKEKGQKDKQRSTNMYITIRMLFNFIYLF